MSQVMSDMTIAELRATAKAMNIAGNREWTKDDYIQAINSRRGGKAVAKVVEDADSPIPEGYARIRIQQQAGFTGPVDVLLNKFKSSIPRDVWVDIPCEVVDGPLEHSMDWETKGEVSSGERSSRRTAVKAYPFIERGRNPLPEGKGIVSGSNSDETQSIRKQYRQIFGRWPTNQQFKDASKELSALKHKMVFNPESLTAEQRVILGLNKKE